MSQSQQSKCSSSTKELEDGLLEDLTEFLKGGSNKERTLEEALQEALDNTTPEEPGAPEKKKKSGREPGSVEWL